jgi:hypothetical protein
MLNSLRTKNNTALELEKHVLDTYVNLRIGIIVIAIVFPFWLWRVGDLKYDIPRQSSISAYYHASANDKSKECEHLFQELRAKDGQANSQAIDDNRAIQLCRAAQYGAGAMRNWFVGVLFGVGVFLCLYKGFSTTENYALNIAGVLALGIALNPMDLWETSRPGTLHGFCAVSFFLVIAFVALFCARDTLHLIDDEKKRRWYSGLYLGLGSLMIILPLATWAYTVATNNGSRVFFLEAAGIIAFSLYWLVKTFEMRRTEALARAARGELEIVKGKVVPRGHRV